MCKHLNLNGLQLDAHREPERVAVVLVVVVVVVVGVIVVVDIGVVLIDSSF